MLAAIPCNLVELASSQSRNSVAAACEILNRCEGKVTQGLTIADVTSEVQSKSDDELAFYLQNGRWPESELNSGYPADSGEAKRA